VLIDEGDPDFVIAIGLYVAVDDVVGHGAPSQIESAQYALIRHLT
jgi:hypothetical protein